MIRSDRFGGWFRLVLAAGIALFGACSEPAGQAGDRTESAEPPRADLVITSARIFTAEPDALWADALAVRGDTIVAVGSNADVSGLIGPDTEQIDAPPGMVAPGFIDSHVHFLDGGFSLASVQLRDAATPAEFTDRIGTYAAGLAAGEWITNGDWDHENWGGELPRRDWIDAVTPDNPVMINRLDGHMVLANSRALDLAGVSADTADVPGGEIVRDAEGNPTGVLKDNAMALVSRVMPAPSEAQLDRALRAISAYVAAQGVTSVHDMAGWQSQATYRRAHAAGSLHTRIYSMVPLSDWRRLAEEVATEGRGDEWLRIGGLKGFMDGSLGSHTAAFFEPFTDTPEDRGFFINDLADMASWIGGADAAGLQVMVHAIGDRAISALLDIQVDMVDTNGDRDRRFRIEHAQHIHPDDIVRFAEQNVIASMQPYHAIDDGRWAERVIGPERARTTYAFRALLDAGVPVAFGSDLMVAPPMPLLGIYAAVTRQTLDGAHPQGWVPEEKISVEDALIAYTRTAAYASFEEDLKGSIAAGKLADLVMIDQDLTRIAPEAIRDARVTRTILGGRTVYQAVP
jgi:predicted amidohydrolase YtcJ